MSLTGVYLTGGITDGQVDGMGKREYTCYRISHRVVWRLNRNQNNGLCMNKLKGLKLRFYVKDNQELAEAIQGRLFELGVYWSNGETIQMIPPSYDSILVGCYDLCTMLWSTWHDGLCDNYTPATLDTLYHLPKTHTITIDGKDIELSDESYAAFKEQFE